MRNHTILSLPFSQNLNSLGTDPLRFRLKQEIQNVHKVELLHVQLVNNDLTGNAINLAISECGREIQSPTGGYSFVVPNIVDANSLLVYNSGDFEQVEQFPNGVFRDIIIHVFLDTGAGANLTNLTGGLIILKIHHHDN